MSAWQAVAATPADHPRRATRLSNLAIQLRHRSERTGAAGDVDAAIDMVRQALATTSADHPKRALFLSNLGLALETRFGLLGAPTDLDEAIDMGRRAVAAAVADPPARATFLLNLGGALLTRYEYFGAPADLTAAIEADRDTVAVKLASPRLRARAARSWGRAAAAGQRWSEAIEGFEAAIDLVGRVVPRSLTRADQERLLTELGTLGPDAAACCLQAGRTGRAAELFEQGRGVLLGQALDSRTDLTSLTRLHPQLTQRFTTLAGELDRADPVTSPWRPVPAPPARASSRRQPG